MTNKQPDMLQLNIKNAERFVFMEKLLSIPASTYEVEQLKDGSKIIIKKPGEKGPNDFLVYIYTPSNGYQWQITHWEIKEDLIEKYNIDSKGATEIVMGLYKVCLGQEPDDVLKTLKANFNIGLSPEAIYKVYKWIWGQEDCNYHKKNQKGRWMSMENIFEHFNIKINLKAFYEKTT